MLKADSFYKETILSNSEELSLTLSLDGERNNAVTESKESMLPDLGNLGFRGAKNKGGVYYISDIHLDHKIYKKFGERGNRKKVEKFIQNIAKKLTLNDDDEEIYFPIGSSTIVILGDTSHSFEINKLFYRSLSQSLPYYRDIFVVLGNHELWEFSGPEEAINAYQKFFDSLPNIHLLQNSLYISNPHTRHEDIDNLWAERRKIIQDKSLSTKVRDKALVENEKKLDDLRRKYYGNSEEEQHKSRIKLAIITKDELDKMSAEEIRSACFDSKTILFGTMGCAAYNPVYDVYSGIYRNAITTKDQEIRLSKEAEGIYIKLANALPENYLIVASHMPLSDWAKTPHVPKWQYFSGHTHINKKTMTEDTTEYSDNQVGYYGKRIKFNAVVIDEKVDYFAYLEDGIHYITETEYRNYYSGFSKYLSGVDKRGCENSKIIMLKNNGMYLFLIKKESTGQLYLLEGGKRRVLNNQDIQYYYDNMSKLNDALSQAVVGIRKYLEEISLFVKRIGGVGYIHGNIVDIDFYNHIMVDLETGALLSYFALSVNDRYEFKDVPKLLETTRQDLYRKYLSGNESVPAIRKDTLSQNTFTHSNDSSIYRNSNIMLKIQDMLDYNVIRFWNDELIDIINKKHKSVDSYPKLLG